MATDVSVIIPTSGRSSVLAAASSVLAQTLMPLEILIVVDGDHAKTAEVNSYLGELSTHPLITICSTGGLGNANAARQKGVDLAMGSLIAFLDDDDTWRRDKLEIQLRAASPLALERTIVTSSVALIASDGRRVGIWPSSPPKLSESTAAYLTRRTITKRSPFLQTSTWLVAREVLARHPLSSDLRGSLHDDLDWLIRADRQFGLRPLHVNEALSNYSVSSPDSFTRRTSWRQSADWVATPTLPLTNRERGDFLLGVPLRIALRDGSRRSGVTVLLYATKHFRPSISGIAYAIVKILSRHL